MSRRRTCTSRGSIPCRLRITASSPCMLGMIETRTSIVPRQAHLEPCPSCGTRFSAMSSSAMTSRADDRPESACRSAASAAADAVDAIPAQCTRIVLRFDVMSLAAGSRCRWSCPPGGSPGSHRWSASRPSATRRRSRLCTPSVQAVKLCVASSSTRSSSLFLGIDSIAVGVPTVDLDFGVTTRSQLVDHRQDRWSETTIAGRALPSRRRRSRCRASGRQGSPNSSVVDAELRRDRRSQPIALGKPLRLRDLRRVLAASRIGSTLAT